MDILIILSVQFNENNVKFMIAGLRSSVSTPCFKLLFFGLPLHGPLSHGLVSLSDPEHCAPPLDGGGLVQVRNRSCCPAPQVTLHSLQSP